MKQLLVLVSITALLVGCNSNSNPDPQNDIQESQWRGVITIVDSVELPFTFTFTQGGVRDIMTIENGDERIEIDSIRRVGDTSYLYLPVFPTAFVVHQTEDEWKGYWVRLDQPDYRLPFQAAKGLDHRFTDSCQMASTLAPRWEAHFRIESENPLPAIGQFQQDEDNPNVITGSFARETGDYRYLAGNMCGDEFRLSGFDGTHAFVFEATLKNDTLRGTRYSGKSYSESWIAYPSETFELRDPTQLTFLKEGYESVEFSLPTVNGESFQFDGASSNGPTIIQIMGSWCPNCMDETRYFKELHEKYADRGLNIIGVTYEYFPELDKARPYIQKMIDDLEIPYPIVFGGQASRDQIETTLPMIDNFMSYPTSIFIDAEGNVRRIHTGFNGPGTADYQAYVEETEHFINSLLSE